METEPTAIDIARARVLIELSQVHYVRSQELYDRGKRKDAEYISTLSDNAIYVAEELLMLERVKSRENEHFSGYIRKDVYPPLSPAD